MMELAFLLFIVFIFWKDIASGIVKIIEAWKEK